MDKTDRATLDEIFAQLDQEQAASKRLISAARWLIEENERLRGEVVRLRDEVNSADADRYQEFGAGEKWTPPYPDEWATAAERRPPLNP